MGGAPAVPTETASGWPPAFTVDAARILELLTGDRFYSSKDAALREAVLNSIDGCARRRVEDDSFRPEIVITFDDASQTLRIDDNGDGMARIEISRLFTRIGASMSQLITNADSVGEFGIGVISYFLVCDEFEVHTCSENYPAVGLAFSSSMLDASTPARVIPTDRSDVGTTLVLHVRTQALFDLLFERFPYWCRGVEGLSATRGQDKSTVDQGRSVTPATEVALEVPEWVEGVHLGPPTGFDGWSVLDGRATVDILYRGVYVQTEHVDGLWGMTGSIEVHPKRLKPQLNREGFQIEDLQRDVVPFLTQSHPKVLGAGLATLAAALDDPAAKDWSISHLVTLWLAVPRSEAYAEVVQGWDDLFRSKRLFRHLGKTDDEELSLEEIKALPTPLYLAPNPLPNATPIVRAAVRVLRAKGNSVLQGITRDSTGYLDSASFVSDSTSALLMGNFRDELGEVIEIAPHAEALASDAVKVAKLFRSSPEVELVRIGEDGTALVNVGGRLWINLDTPGGRAIVQTVCSENKGRTSLLVACHAHAEDQINAVSTFWRTSDPDADHLGLVLRDHLRRMAT